jgi:hypothetical protein
VGDTNYHLMRLWSFVSCWVGNKIRGTHHWRTIDVVFARQAARRVETFDLGVPGEFSDHRGVVATYVITPVVGDTR